MKLLLYAWNANNEQILADNLIKFGFEVIWFCEPCKHFTRDIELAAKMIPYIHQKNINAVISFNYFPIISMICDTCKIPYYAWIYDSPHFTLYARQVMLPCNHIGIFDKDMVHKLQGKGVQTAFHIPLSVDADCFEQVIRRAGRKESEMFQSDISFVGSLYTDEHNYYNRLLEKQEQEQFDCMIRKQCFSYEVDYISEALVSGEIDIHVIQEKMEQEGLMLGEDYFADAEDVLQAVVLEKKVTVEERRILLNRIAEKFGEQYRLSLYSGSDLHEQPMLKKYHKGIVNYHKQMPLVFSGSKINLNFSLRSIHSGIPLRVLDIMACGGFVLSNWQPEIAEYFEEGKEIATFTGLEDCMDKISFYLTHDEERRLIAERGKKKVKDMFSYQEGLEKLFAI
ncbi:MAG: glycosyltransferase [Lachnospiraceae bacterium]|nr:glycosyltransferase [Lachnospiraceae bacterium]